MGFTDRSRMSSDQKCIALLSERSINLFEQPRPVSAALIGFVVGSDPISHMVSSQTPEIAAVFRNCNCDSPEIALLIRKEHALLKIFSDSCFLLLHSFWKFILV